MDTAAAALPRDWPGGRFLGHLGVALFLVTLFAPTQDRDQPAGGFNRKVGDVVTIASERLGRLVNRVVPSDGQAPWACGIAAMLREMMANGAAA